MQGKITRAVGMVAAGVLVGSGAAIVLMPTTVSATPVAREVRVANTDWVSAGVGGIGQASSGGGSADIALSGVSGTVTGAYLAWDGIGPESSPGAQDYSGAYNNPTITVNGKSVTGSSRGETGSNCWGDGTTNRAYVADVTSIVKATGNGTYSLAGLGNNGNANGAHLVVTYNDGDSSNNRDLYLYYGNDTDADGFPGEDFTWNDQLMSLNYQGGVARLQLAVTDGQDFGPGDDGDLTVTGSGGSVTFADNETNNNLWDGASVPDAGHGRAPNGSLYDLENFDVTAALGDPGVQDLSISSPLVNDCHSLVMAAFDVPATASQPAAPVTVSVSPASAREGTNAPGQNKFSHLYLHLTLSKRSTSDQTVVIHTEDGTATAPEDYKSTARTVTIRAGQRFAVLTVLVRRDALAEGDEYLYGVVDSASVPVATNAAVGTIVDDDTASDARSAARSAARSSRVAHNGGIGR